MTNLIEKTTPLLTEDTPFRRPKHTLAAHLLKDTGLHQKSFKNAQHHQL